MLLRNIEELSAKDFNSKSVKTVKRLDETLCKIIGAYIADGHLSKIKTKDGCRFRLIVIDHDRFSLEAFKRWIKKTFGLNCRIEKAICDAWAIVINNKIIGRYFERILDLPIGHKVTNVNIPHIIKNSKENFQRAFLCGYMTFDGCVETCGAVTFGSSSKLLRDEIITTFKKFGIKMLPLTKSDEYHATSNKISKKEIKRWMKFFEEGTEKFYKLKDMLDGFKRKVHSIEEALVLFDKTYSVTNSSKITINSMINALKEMGTCDKYILSKKLNVGISTLYRYIHHLENANILERTEYPEKAQNLDFFHQSFTRVLIENKFRRKIFRELLNKFDENSIAKELDISVETFRNWHYGLTKISLNKLRKILSLINFNSIESSRHLIKFNRKVFNFNSNIKEWLLPQRPWINA